MDSGFSGWDYRVVRRQDGGETWLQICEVYFNDEGAPFALCDATPQGETPEELASDVEAIAEALGKPVIDEREIEANPVPKGDPETAIPLEQALKELEDGGEGGGAPDSNGKA